MSAHTATLKARQGTLLLSSFAGACALVLTYLLAVRTPQGQALDTRAMIDASAALVGQTWTSTVLSLISPLSVVIATVSIAGLAAISGGRRAAFRVLVTTGATIVGAALLKAVLVRPEFGGQSGNSLPSGHVAAVAALTVAASMAVPTAHRMWVVLVGGAATVATGVATLALGWHRPSDVVAAMLLAITVGCISAGASSSSEDTVFREVAEVRGHQYRLSRPYASRGSDLGDSRRHAVLHRGRGDPRHHPRQHRTRVGESPFHGDR